MLQALRVNHNHSSNPVNSLYPLVPEETTPWIIEKIDGLGPVPATVNLTSIAGQDGAIYNSSRIDYRTIDITLLSNSWQNLEQLRYNVYNDFPVGKAVQLRFTTDTRDVSCLGYVASCEPDIFSERVRFTIGVNVPSPYFSSYHPVSISYSGVSGGFIFPFEDPPGVPDLAFADIQSFREKTFDYNGDIPAGVTGEIICSGPATDVQILSLVRPGEGLYLETDRLSPEVGALRAGDTILFSTAPDNKYVRVRRGSRTYNQYHIQRLGTSIPLVHPGYNGFVFNAASGIDHLRFRLSYRELYRGL